jgi:hypothetical protein
VQSLSSFIGIDGTNTTMNSGRIQINLKPLEERKINASEVIRRLQPRLALVDDITLFMQPVQDLTVETRVSRTQYQYSLEDPDAQELGEWAPRFVAALQKLPQLRDVASDQQTAGRVAHVVIDRDTASRLGITPQMIDDALYDAFGQRQISIMFTQLNQYRLVLEVKPDLRNELRDLNEIYIKPLTGGVTPLGTFTRVEEKTAPLAINHQGQFPVVTVSFNLAPGVSLGEAVEAIDAAELELAMPRSIVGEYQGTAQAFQASLTNTPLLILAALVTVYIVLGVLYESYIHPITILSTLPSAGVGALVALLLCRTDLSVIALIGIILLIGIVKKNAIMMIDFALVAQRVDRCPPGGRAARVRHGGRLGAAPAAGHHDYRRADLQPVAHSVYDAGDLSVVRPAGDAAGVRRDAGRGDGDGSSWGAFGGAHVNTPMALRRFADCGLRIAEFGLNREACSAPRIRRSTFDVRCSMFADSSESVDETTSTGLKNLLHDEEHAGGPAVCAAPAGSRSDKRRHHSGASGRSRLRLKSKRGSGLASQRECGWRGVSSLRDPAALTGRQGHPIVHTSDGEDA